MDLITHGCCTHYFFVCLFTLPLVFCCCCGRCWMWVHNVDQMLKHLIITIRMQKADLWQECANRTNVESWMWREKKTQTKYFFCGCIAMVFSFFIQPSSAMSIDVEIRKHEPIDFGLSVWKPYHTTSIYYHFFFVFVPSAAILVVLWNKIKHQFQCDPIAFAPKMNFDGCALAFVWHCNVL